MRFATLAVLACALLSGCKPGGIGSTEELCAKAAAIYDRCEKDQGSMAVDRDLELDRWRSICRAVITGETKQMLPDALALYQEMDDGTKAALRAQAECTAKTTTCDAYAACSK